MQLKRRADRADRFREAAGAVAAAALDADGVLQALVRAAVATLDCDWAAVALREQDGRLVIAALEGRGAGWAQRWSLSEQDGFCARVLASGQSVTTADAEQMGYTGADRPVAVVAAPLGAARQRRGRRAVRRPRPRRHARRGRRGARRIARRGRRPGARHGAPLRGFDARRPADGGARRRRPPGHVGRRPDRAGAGRPGRAGGHLQRCRAGARARRRRRRAGHARRARAARRRSRPSSRARACRSAIPRWPG